MPRAKNSKRRQHAWDASLATWYSEKKPIVWFCAKFGALVILLYALLAIPLFDHGLYTYLHFNAWLSNNILNGLGENSYVEALTIKSDDFNFEVQRGCDAVEATWIYCAAIFASQASMLSKMKGIAIGILSLQAVNLLRIVTLFWIGMRYPAVFNTAHMEIWPVIFILVSMILFLVWRDQMSEFRRINAAI